MKKEFDELKKMFYVIYTNYLTYLVKPMIFLLIFVLFFNLLAFTFNSSNVLLDVIINLFFPFILGLSFSMLLEPVNKFLIRRFGIPRWLSVLLTLSVSVFIFFGFLIFSIYYITVQLYKVINSLIIYFKDVDYTYLYNSLLDSINNTFLKSYFSEDSLDSYYASFMSNWQSWLSKGTDVVGTLGAGSLNVLNSTANLLPTLLLVIVLSILTSFFLSKDKDICLKLLSDILPSSFYDNIFLIREHIIKNLILFIRGQILLVTLTGVIFFVCFLLIDFPYAFLFALLCIILDLLPIVGTAVLILPWSIYCFFTGDYFTGSMLLGFYVFSFVFRQVIEPKILGDSLGLHPLLLLISIYSGMKLFGGLGLIIGPLSLIIVKILFDIGLLKFNKVNDIGDVIDKSSDDNNNNIDNI